MIQFSLGPSLLDDNALAVNVSKFLKAQTERLHTRGGLLPCSREIADPCDFRAGLGQEERRPPSRCGPECHELTSSHSITSSARARSVGGIVRPSALAAFKFRTNSNFVGDWMGKVPGYSPRTMRST